MKVPISRLKPLFEYRPYNVYWVALLRILRVFTAVTLSIDDLGLRNTTITTVTVDSKYWHLTAQCSDQICMRWQSLFYRKHSAASFSEQEKELSRAHFGCKRAWNKIANVTPRLVIRQPSVMLTTEEDEGADYPHAPRRRHYQKIASCLAKLEENLNKFYFFFKI